MKRPATFAALVVFAAAAQAASETYVIDASRTSSLFSYRSLGIDTQTHRFEKISGTVVVDHAARTGRADVRIDATSVDTGLASLNETIQGPDFFDSANYPSITFRSTRMTLDGERPSLSGELSIKGVTRPVTLALSSFNCAPDATFKADVCRARASVTIRRSDFNMRKYAFLVSDDVTLSLALRAVKDTPQLQLASRDPAR
jgi:polyisoprenoid-binding protein YceI